MLFYASQKKKKEVEREERPEKFPTLKRGNFSQDPPRSAAASFNSAHMLPLKFFQAWPLSLQLLIEAYHPDR